MKFYEVEIFWFLWNLLTDLKYFREWNSHDPQWNLRVNNTFIADHSPDILYIIESIQIFDKSTTLSTDAHFSHDFNNRCEW